MCTPFAPFFLKLTFYLCLKALTYLRNFCAFDNTGKDRVSLHFTLPRSHRWNFPGFVVVVGFEAHKVTIRGFVNFIVPTSYAILDYRYIVLVPFRLLSLLVDSSSLWMQFELKILMTAFHL